MDELYTRFAKLPQAVQQSIASPEALDALDLLEDQYNISLAETLMRVLLGDVARENLPKMFQQTFHMPSETAEELTSVLNETLLRREPAADEHAEEILRPLRNGSAPVADIRKPTLVLPTAQTPQTPKPAAAPRIVGARMQRPAAATPSGQQKQHVPPPNLPVSNEAPVRPVPRQAVSRPTSPPAPHPPSSAPPASQRTSPPNVSMTPSERPTARFYMDPEDDADIRQHAAVLTHAHASALPAADADDAFIRSLEEQFQLHFSDKQLEQRFRLAVLSRLRTIRDSAAFQQLLQRPVDAGGLGLPPAVAARLTGQVAAAAAARQEGAMTPPTARSETPAVQQGQPTAPPVVPAAVRAAARGMRFQPPAPPRPAPQPVQHAAPPTPAPRPRLRRDAQDDGSGRPVIQDIKRPVQPMGPVDELSAYVPDDLHAAGWDAAHVVGQILEKIRLLTEESYELRAQGIAAWRRSPLYQLYMEVGRESITTGVSVEDILAQRERERKPVLTTEEFLRIADLNRQLTL